MESKLGNVFLKNPIEKAFKSAKFPCALSRMYILMDRLIKKSVFIGFIMLIPQNFRDQLKHSTTIQYEKIVANVIYRIYSTF